MALRAGFWRHKQPRRWELKAPIVMVWFSATEKKADERGRKRRKAA
jgi:hypothetical protein